MFRFFVINCFALCVYVAASTTQSPAYAQILKSFGQLSYVGQSKGKDHADAQFSTYRNNEGDRTPLLSGFCFTYLVNDHHLKRFRLMPKTEKTQERALRVESSFADHNGDDPYKWQASYLAVESRPLRINRVTGQMRGAKTVRLASKPQNRVFVLIGFDFSYDKSDHHIDRIGIREVRGFLHLEYSDKNGDDPVSYEILYAYVPGTSVRSSEKIIGKRAFAQHIQQPNGTHLSANSVISGFQFDYSKDDHHIRSVGAELIGKKVRATYKDKDGRDEFNYCLDVTTLYLN